jgi:hypothetical protein
MPPEAERVVPFVAHRPVAESQTAGAPGQTGRGGFQASRDILD